MHDKTTTNYSADEAAIHDLNRRLVDGWNRVSGDDFAAAFDKFLKDTRLTGRVESVKFLSPDVVLVHAVTGTVMRSKSEPSSERDSIQKLWAVREGDEWRLAALATSGFVPQTTRRELYRHEVPIRCPKDWSKDHDRQKELRG